MVEGFKLAQELGSQWVERYFQSFNYSFNCIDAKFSSLQQFLTQAKAEQEVRSKLVSLEQVLNTTFHDRYIAAAREANPEEYIKGYMMKELLNKEHLTGKVTQGDIEAYIVTAFNEAG